MEAVVDFPCAGLPGDGVPGEHEAQECGIKPDRHGVFQSLGKSDFARIQVRKLLNLQMLHAARGWSFLMAVSRNSLGRSRAGADMVQLEPNGLYLAHELSDEQALFCL